MVENRLRELRGPRPLSEIARMLGTSYVTVHKHETGQLRISPAHAYLYATIYRVRPEELFVITNGDQRAK